MIENWPVYRLEDLCTYITDGAHHSPKSVDKGVPMASVKDMTDFGFDYSSCRQISEEDYQKLKKGKCEPEIGDVLIAKDGSYLKHCFEFRDTDQKVVLLSSIAIFRPDFKKTSSKFLKYLFRSPAILGLARNYVSGVAIPRIVLSDFKRLKLSIPPLPTQRKIAAILSVYDDLIENNLKRIKLLEEKAQLTYEEWFVRMKFPGHETTPVNEETGLTEGWSKEVFSHVVRVNPRTKIIKGTIAPYIPMGSLSENGMVIDPIEERAAGGGAKFQNGDTLFARITPCLENGKTGFVQFMELDDQVATGSTEFIVFRETETVGRHFIYCTSRSERFRELAIKSMAGSDGRQRVKNDSFDKFDFSCPPPSLMKEFEESASALFSFIQTMINQNQLLKEARDLLLPRLMTGMIDVEELDLSAFEQEGEEEMLMAAEAETNYKPNTK